jgi:aconitate hydratase
MVMASLDSFGSLDQLQVHGIQYEFFSLARAQANGLGGINQLPYCLKILLENLLRHEDGDVVTKDDLQAFSTWSRDGHAARDLAFHPARILMPDSSGIPLLGDLAAMRDAMHDLGGDINTINPQVLVDCVVDHSVTVASYGNAQAREFNMALEYQRNRERYEFLRWAQKAFSNVRIVPPGVGICHQINVEYLSSVVTTINATSVDLLCPDTMLGMDSHTPMVNALGVLGWGVGGIEAASAMLGQPVSLQMPRVVGMRLEGQLAPGVTATDLVLTLTERLRAHGVVQKFVEFCGPGLDHLAVPDRATCANMAPEYGATIGFFPLDVQTLDYLRLTGRDESLVTRIEAYVRAQGLWREPGSPDPRFSDSLTLDLSSVEPSLAGPRRPQDRVALGGVPDVVRQALTDSKRAVPDRRRAENAADRRHDVRPQNGDVVLAAISSCTNTSNPANMLSAGLLAKAAVARGLKSAPWVKTSLSPGSRVVAHYLELAGLQSSLDTLGFQITGFGCMTCMGNSGPLPDAVATAIDENGLAVGSVVSNNRNFEGRVHPQCELCFIASPPLVIAYALAGRLDIDLTQEALGIGSDGHPVYLKDLWPSAEQVKNLADQFITAQGFRHCYADIFAGDERWQALPVRGGSRFEWNSNSSYLKPPPFFDGISASVPVASDVISARALVMLGDSITTDHISPVGVFDSSTAAGAYLASLGIAPEDFSSYSARRVNHHVMMRGTFANIRLRNTLAADGRSGGYTTHMPSGDDLTVYDAAMRYADDGAPG